MSILIKDTNIEDLLRVQLLFKGHEIVELSDHGDLIEREEPEINPCRGCDDYDGRGGCKSHGGCGAERSEE